MALNFVMTTAARHTIRRCISYLAVLAVNSDAKLRRASSAVRTWALSKRAKILKAQRNFQASAMSLTPKRVKSVFIRDFAKIVFTSPVRSLALFAIWAQAVNGRIDIKGSAGKVELTLGTLFKFRIGKRRLAPCAFSMASTWHLDSVTRLFFFVTRNSIRYCILL